MKRAISSGAPGVPALSPEVAVEALGDATRWRILGELSAGEPLMVVELAERLGKGSSAISKHLGVLRRAGLVAQARNRLHRIPAQFLSSPGSRTVDFGFCLLRFEAVAE